MKCPVCDTELIKSKVGYICPNPKCRVFDDYKFYKKK